MNELIVLLSVATAIVGWLVGENRALRRRIVLLEETVNLR